MIRVHNLGCFCQRPGTRLTQQCIVEADRVTTPCGGDGPPISIDKMKVDGEFVGIVSFSCDRQDDRRDRREWDGAVEETSFRWRNHHSFKRESITASSDCLIASDDGLFGM